MSSINKLRANIVAELNGMESHINKILNDKSKIKSDRIDLAQHATEGVLSKIEGYLNQMVDVQAEYLRKARQKYESAKLQDMTVTRTRAAVLIPALANAKDDDLLKLFEARAGDRIDREIIGELIKVRADMKPGDINPLAEKFHQIDAATVDQLPESEQAALRELQNANNYQAYVESAIVEAYAGFEKVKRSIEGRSIESVDGVKLKTAKHILDNMDEGKTFKPGTLTVEMTETEGVKEAFNTQQKVKEKQRSSTEREIEPDPIVYE